ncbi:hypothetical protein DNTS_005163 [Danionella cerebrum]|uniref:Uncharacterized protein n=1 Tax=Danionella cerebrum TaxID=2873325 RepID=A0A553QEY5_9TELE|nr:hypothetical protein DNTS_005163 [Danionella translucida]
MCSGMLIPRSVRKDDVIARTNGELTDYNSRLFSPITITHDVILYGRGLPLARVRQLAERKPSESVRVLLTPPMDDEEGEQFPRSFEILTNKCSEKRDASSRHRRFEERSTQTARSLPSSPREREMAPFQGAQRDALSPCGALEATTAFRAHWEGTGHLASLFLAPGALDGTRALFHENAGFRAHFPALFEHVPHGVQSTEQRGVTANRPDQKEEDSGSVEIQIGRKLREMGDQFQQEHLQMLTQRGQLGWFQLVTSIYNFLFPQERPQHARGQR